MINVFLKEQEETVYLQQLIADIRADHPTLNCKAMYYKIKPECMGRDKFEKLCTTLGFNVVRSKARHITTDSSGVIRFDNLLKGTRLTGINQAYSSDITYYEINNVFYYITFVIDCYSRRILGHNVSQRLTTEMTTIPALKMAIKNRKNHLPQGIIFHSDGGGQYYSKTFLKLTSKYQFKNSMCEFSYDNGMVERLNGVIKNNYLKFKEIKTYPQLTKEVDQIISLYNNDRPHKSLKYKTPNEYEIETLTL
jgi:putative transposase